MILPNLRAEAAPIGHVALRAEAATVDDVDVARRIITGTVVPYGEPGRTHLGARALRAGAVRFRQPADPMVIGLYGHNRERTVSRLIGYENTASRLRARFRVASTPLGDQLLAEADPTVGVRSMLSIELDGCSIDPASGDIIDGLCEFVAHVPIGAYDSAHVDSVVAAAVPILDQIGDDVSRRALARRYSREFITVGGGGQPAAPAAPAATPATGQPATAPAPAPAGDAQSTAQQQLAQLLAQATGQPAPAAPAPAPAAGGDVAGMLQLLAGLQQLQAGVHVAGAPTGPATLPGGPGATGNAPTTPGTPDVNPVERMARLQAALFAQGGNGSVELRAALADITNTGLDLFQSPAGAIGEQLWQGGGYVRRFVPLMRQRPLTSWKGNGWEWEKKPKLAKYAGDKAQVPTDTVSVRAVEWEAQRVAGGWDIDRKLRDFGDAAFWTGFYDAQAESYRELTDDIAGDQIIAAARDITVDANVPAGYTDMNVAQANVLKAAALGTAILEDTANVRQGPDFIIMNTMDWLRLIDFTQLDLPAFLSLLKVKPENFLRSSKVTPGALIAGVVNATTYRELGGGAPIRVEALNVAQAGIDSAVYGYCATSHDRPGGVISVPITPVVPE